MKLTNFQIMHQAQEDQPWRFYRTIPAQATAEEAQSLLDQHLSGAYKPNQLKSWLLDHKFRVVRCEIQCWEVDNNYVGEEQ